MNFISKQNKIDSLFVLTAQSIVLISGGIRSLLLPVFLSVENYGFWQAYLFYTAYVTVFTLGFSDGVYLRYGDLNYDDLPFLKLRGAIRVFIIMLTTLSSIFLLVILNHDYLSNNNLPKVFALMNIFIMGLYGLLSFILQITNQLRIYSIITSVDKVLLLLFIVSFYTMKYNDIIYLIVVDIFLKLIVLIALSFLCKELIFGPTSNFRISFKEFFTNLSVGYKVLLANILGMLIIGYGRFYLENSDNVNEFANYSLSLSLAGFVITLFTSVSYVIYPKLKRINSAVYSNNYNIINVFLTSALIMGLFGYFPVFFIVNNYFSKYSELLPYLNLIFLITYLQAKSSILHNTFYKILRKETFMLILNISCVVLVISIIFESNQSSLNTYLIAFITYCILLLRTIISELYFNKQLKNTFIKSLFFEVFVLTWFLFLTNNFSLPDSFIYLLTSVALLFLFRINKLLDFLKIKKLKN